jgi:signal peptidase I
MSVNFPLFLVLATAVTGLVWLLEVVWLARRRQVKKTAKELTDSLDQPLVVEYSISFFPVLLFVLVLRSFLFEPFQIPTGSMIPTLNIGDFILVNKYSYGIRLPVVGTKVMDINDPKRGEVMVFIPPHKDEYFIKRIVGLPGDRIRYQDKKLFVNDVMQEQEFVERLTGENSQNMLFEETLGEFDHFIYRNRYKDPRSQSWLVPEGHYFMMGDNRDRSSDSRYWGFVSEDKIVGKAIAVWLHKEPGLNLPEFSQNRWIQ